MRIEPTPGLDDEQIAVHDRLASLVRHSAEADALYNAIPETRGGRVVSVDAARYLLPEFRDRAFRIRHTPSTATPAGAYAHDRMIRTLRLGPPTAGAIVRFMAGGAGSGKTSSLGGDPIPGVSLVFDNQLLSYPRASELLRLSSESGWVSHVIFVFRPFDLVVRGVIDRSVQSGRWNVLRDLPRAHLQAQGTYWRLARDFADVPTTAFGVLENLATPENPRAIRVFSSVVMAPGEPRRYRDISSLERILHGQTRLAIDEGRLPEPLRALCTGEGGG